MSASCIKGGIIACLLFNVEIKQPSKYYMLGVFTRSHLQLKIHAALITSPELPRRRHREVQEELEDSDFIKIKN